MDVSQMQKLPGMPSGFPFAMVVVGILAILLAGVFGSIDALFFRSFGTGLASLGHVLISFGAFLQAVLWVCSAFAKKSSGTPAP